jgi:hypothetical protein
MERLLQLHVRAAAPEADREVQMPGWLSKMIADAASYVLSVLLLAHLRHHFHCPRMAQLMSMLMKRTVMGGEFGPELVVVLMRPFRVAGQRVVMTGRGLPVADLSQMTKSWTSLLSVC